MSSVIFSTKSVYFIELYICSDCMCAREYLYFQWKLPSFSVFFQPTMRELFRNKVETRQTFLWHREREITTDKSERKIMVVVVKL